MKVKRSRAGHCPDDIENTRANVAKPRWTRPRRVNRVVSPVSEWISDPVTHKRSRKVHVTSFFNLQPILP